MTTSKIMLRIRCLNKFTLKLLMESCMKVFSKGKQTNLMGFFLVFKFYIKSLQIFNLVIPAIY